MFHQWYLMIWLYLPWRPVALLALVCPLAQSHQEAPEKRSCGFLYRFTEHISKHALKTCAGELVPERSNSNKSRGGSVENICWPAYKSVICKWDLAIGENVMKMDVCVGNSHVTRSTLANAWCCNVQITLVSQNKPILKKFG